MKAKEGLGSPNPHLIIWQMCTDSSWYIQPDDGGRRVFRNALTVLQNKSLKFSQDEKNLEKYIPTTFILCSVFEMRTTSAKPRTNMAFLYPLLAICIRHKSLNIEAVNMDRITPGNNAQSAPCFLAFMSPWLQTLSWVYPVICNAIDSMWHLNLCVKQRTDSVSNFCAVVSPGLCLVKYYAYGHVTLHQV